MTESRRWVVTADDGVRLQAEAWPATVSDAPLVLGLHGITANRYGFGPLIEELAGEVEFVSYDARGRGRSDKPEDPGAYGHRRHARDAANVLEDLGRPADVVLGQSMGAWVGLLLAADRPGLVGALVLGDGGYFPDLPSGVQPDEYVDRIMGAGWLARLAATAPSREAIFTALRAVPTFRDIWSPQLQRLFDEGLEDRPDGTVGHRCSVVAAAVDAVDYFEPAGRLPYVRECLARVTCPVHLVRAPRGFEISPETRDPLISEAALAEFQRELPQLTVETIPDTNHYSVNFGERGVAALADAIRKALVREQP